MIDIKNVTKKFGTHTVLNGISMTVPTGSVTVILGPSGSGKTTFLRTLNFLGQADGGTMTLNDLSVKKGYLSCAAQYGHGLPVV